MSYRVDLLRVYNGPQMALHASRPNPVSIFPRIPCSKVLHPHETNISSCTPPVLLSQCSRVLAWRIWLFGTPSFRLVLRCLRLPPCRVLQKRCVHRTRRQMHISHNGSTDKHILSRALPFISNKLDSLFRSLSISFRPKSRRKGGVVCGCIKVSNVPNAATASRPPPRRYPSTLR